MDRLSHICDWMTLRHRCIICSAIGPAPICQQCLSDYLISPRYSCRQCALPLENHAIICGECLRHPPTFDKAFCPYLYRPPISQLLNQFKHHSNHIIGYALCQLFCIAIKEHHNQQHIPLPDYIIAVPLHWRRQWKRGFNQAELLAETLASNLNINMLYAKKIKSTQTQEALSRQKRMLNLRNSFIFKKTLQGQSIAIVDDVMTTGATANQLASTLKKAGAGEVAIWALARTEK